jgi:UDP-glucose:(heptosyl)LPS alpha-1,3-glucosyltransferase
MIVAVVIERLDPARGGAEVYAVDFCRWLLAAGHEVTLVAGDWPEDVEATLRGTGGVARFERIDTGGGPRATRALLFARRAAHRVAALRRAGRIDVSIDMGGGQGCDVVQPHCGVPRDAFYAKLASTPSRARRAWYRLAAVADPAERLRSRLTARRFRRQPTPEVVAVSRLVGDGLRRVFDLPQEKIHVIPNGVDLERFSPSRLISLRVPARAELQVGARPLVLTVAQDYRRKGVAAVMALARRAAGRGDPFAFVVVGGGARHREPFERAARREGCCNIRFVGPTAGVERYYAAADLFLLPTFYDPCALSVPEALAAGLPVITTSRNGASELMEHGRHGFIVDNPADIEAIDESLRSLLDPVRRAGMGMAAGAAARYLSCEVNFRGVLEVLAAASGTPASNPAAAASRR